jgi:hypothetical protein
MHNRVNEWQHLLDSIKQITYDLAFMYAKSGMSYDIPVIIKVPYKYMDDSFNQIKISNGLTVEEEDGYMDVTYLNGIKIRIIIDQE